MAYYMYRINTGYDGFYPSEIRNRAPRGRMTYNWSAYVENLERGDIVLTYFTGTGCRTGVHAVAVVTRVDPTTRDMNVEARLLRHSDHDRRPLIPVRGNEALFARIRTRPRGAEVIVPDTCEEDVFRALAQDAGVLAAADKRNIVLPGSIPRAVTSIGDVPVVDLEADLSSRVQRRGVVAAFWIRPSQASWMTSAPRWLLYVTDVFGKFKSGDTSRLDALAAALVGQIRTAFADPAGTFGAVLGVPLNSTKLKGGEVDRVACLAEAVAGELGIPAVQALRLDGDVSRRLYKLAGCSTGFFKQQYLANLKVNPCKALRECIDAGKAVLLIDDVYTDGVTTQTVIDGVQQAFSDGSPEVQVATLGIMAKMANMDDDLIERWR